MLREYVTLGGVTLAVIDSLGTSYVHNDHLSTGQKMTGDGGAVVWDASYRPFGEATITAAAATLNQRFPGQYADAETGYSDNWNRTYDPSLGRYLQSDPIGLAGGLNLYAYAGGNPVMRFDRRGLDWWQDTKDFGKGVAVAAGIWAVAVTAPVSIPIAVGAVILAGTGWQAYQTYGAGKVVWDQYKNGGWCNVDNLALANFATEAFWLLNEGGAALKYGYRVLKSRGAREPFVPDEYWNKNAPDQIEPGTVRRDHKRTSKRTERDEDSRVIYDEFGRQKYRVDQADHMRPKVHSDPHLHEREYDRMNAPTGKETTYNFFD